MTREVRIKLACAMADLRALAREYNDVDVYNFCAAWCITELLDNKISIERVTDACASIGELVVEADLSIPKEHNIVEFRSKDNER